MFQTSKAVIALAAMLAASIPLTADLAEARGTRATRAVPQAAKAGPAPRGTVQIRSAMQPTAAVIGRTQASAPRLASTRVTETRRVTTQRGTPRVVMTSRTVATRSSTRVAGIAQRAPATAAGDNTAPPPLASTLKHNDFQFRSGEFFEQQQQRGAQ